MLGVHCASSGLSWNGPGCALQGQPSDVAPEGADENVRRPQHLQLGQERQRDSAPHLQGRRGQRSAGHNAVNHRCTHGPSTTTQRRGVYSLSFRIRMQAGLPARCPFSPSLPPFSPLLLDRGPSVYRTSDRWDRQRPLWGNCRLHVWASTQQWGMCLCGSGRAGSHPILSSQPTTQLPVV